MSFKLQHYWQSKWTCPIHGHFTARTREKRGPENPVLCPDCKPLFVDAMECFTSQPVPWVSKPRIPAKADRTPVFSDKAPLRKRGKSW